MNDYLRKYVKLLKAQQDIEYKEIAQYLEVPESSFYTWLRGYYNFGVAKQARLKEILDTLKE